MNNLRQIKNMEPRIETFSEKKLLGMRIKMSFTNNKTGELWRNFMPRRKEILFKIGSELYSIEVYPPNFFDNFNTNYQFEKLAAIEVSDIDSVPNGMEIIKIPSGLYSVFIHKGPASDGPKTYQYIFQTWLPNSEFELDSRPHFAVMGAQYKHEDPSSEEEIWIPVKIRN